MLLKSVVMTNVFKLHPWHGVDIGNEAPELVNPILQAWIQRAWAITNERGRSRNLPEVGT